MITITITWWMIPTLITLFVFGIWIAFVLLMDDDLYGFTQVISLIPVLLFIAAIWIITAVVK